MLFGSFIAGASSEGGGAIAFPVLTLLLDVAPPVARNFSFAIQSVGMTAASLLIIGLKIKIEKTAILYASIGGAFGIILATFFIVPHIPATETKLFFVSLWLSFGFALWYINNQKKREIFELIPNRSMAVAGKLLVFGFIGGCVSAVFGNGIDILTFCLLSLHFKISEKIATPTSVVLMTVNTIIGFLLHVFVIKDFQEQAFHFWLSAIPVVILGAPCGAFIISKIPRHAIAKMLYIIIAVQFAGAFFVIKPTLNMSLLSMAVIVAGSLGFFVLARINRA